MFGILVTVELSSFLAKITCLSYCTVVLIDIIMVPIKVISQ